MGRKARDEWCHIDSHVWGACANVAEPVGPLFTVVHRRGVRKGGGCLLCPLRSMRRLFRPERGEATTAGTCAVARGTDEVMEGSDEDKRTFGHAAGRRRFGV